MSIDIKNLHSKLMETPLRGSGAINCSDDLLRQYPCLVFDPSITGTKNMWHDLMKKASPQGLKKKREYERNNLNQLMHLELERLFQAYVLLKKLLLIKGKVNRLKKVFFRLVEYHFRSEDPPFRLEMGGGASHRVKRVDMIFHKEGNVNRVKRHAEKSEGRPAGSPRRDHSSVAHRQPTVVNEQSAVIRSVTSLQEVVRLSPLSPLMYAVTSGDSSPTVDIQDYPDESSEYNCTNSLLSFESMLRPSTDGTTSEDSEICTNDTFADFDRFLDSISN